MNNKVPSIDYKIGYEPARNQLTSYIPQDSYLERFKQERNDPIASTHSSSLTSYECETRTLTWNAAENTMTMFEQRKKYSKETIKEYIQ